MTLIYLDGYTSLGGTTDTHPNPALLCQPQTPRDSQTENGVQNGISTLKFRPAYELVEDQEERLGRDR
jgi:FAD synthetase